MDDGDFFREDQEFSQEDEDPFEEDYYAFFNIRKEATDDEINNAYRRLSRMYHPDKHSDPEKKTKAEQLFNKTKNIYEVLRDPHKRAIYDTLGLKGLEVDGWELVERAKTPAQIREEYERLAWLEEERRLQQQTNPRGAIVINVNATDMFSTYPVDFSDEYEEEGFFPTIEVSGMSFSQSIEAPLTSKNTACLAGQLQTNNGVGSGSMNCSLRRLTSAKGWTEFDLGFGNGLVLSAKGFRTLSKRSYATVTGDVHFTSRGISPGVALNTAYQFSDQYQGILAWKAGRQSGMTTTLLRNTNFTHTNASLHLGLPAIFGSLSCTWKFQERELKLKAGVKAGTFGYLLEGSAEKKISNYTNVGMTMMVGMPVGVSVRLRLVRSTQTYMCNIALCEEIMPAPIIYGLTVPLLGYAVMKALIIDPYKKEQEERETRRKRETFAARLNEKKKEAEAAIELMVETYRRNKVTEEGKNGLIITRALYGKMDSSSNDLSSMEGDSIEVTIPLQCQVKDSKLIIYESTKAQLPGFYDPCLGEEKVVLIEYLYRGRMHRVVTRDKEPIRIPKQCHCVEPP